MQGIIINPKTSDIVLNCSDNTNYAGHLTLTEANNPESEKSHTGYILSLGNALVLWKSKRIQEHCLSTMESEYITLSMAMLSLVYLSGLMFEIDDIFDLGVGGIISIISTVFEDIASLCPTTVMVIPVVSAENHADIFTKALSFEALACHCKSISDSDLCRLSSTEGKCSNPFTSSFPSYG
eukprot:scaffold2705_cov152-Amphora_coffeaeformis.AAC.3